jgi:16S rRNA (cytidine1402-2'-O)-methyltransferase
MGRGTLYVVGTPIGNLQDITLRAIATLRSVDLIASEDTRHTHKLLQHFQITTPQISYHHHNRQQRLPELLQRLETGQAIALVTDAGTPSIADPGLELVQACIAAEIPVVPIPGVSACLTALVVSGLDTARFVYEGFLPVDQSGRSRMQELVREQRTMIFYAAPHHLLQTLTLLAEALGQERRLVVARELTKIHEQLWRGTLAEAIAYFSEHAPKGEFTLVVAGASPEAVVWSEASLQRELHRLLSEGLSVAMASKQLAEITGLPRRQLYSLALQITAKNPH